MDKRVLRGSYCGDDVTTTTIGPRADEWGILKGEDCANLLGNLRYVEQIGRLHRQREMVKVPC